MKKKPLRITARYRNKLEKAVGKQLEDAGVSFAYEPGVITYMVPARKAKYLPDFCLNDKHGNPTSIIIESKGYFRKGAADRKKLLLVRDSHPYLDIRLVFSDASKPIYKGSKTTYGEWATENGFKWSDKGVVPREWLEKLKG